MRRHRWGWRIAVISPAVVAAGVVAMALTGAGPALAAGASGSPSPCPSGLTGTVCQTATSLPSPVASAASPVSSAVSRTVGSVTGATASPSPAGGSTGQPGNGPAGPGTGAQAGPAHSQAKSSGSHRSHPASALGPGKAIPPNLSLLSSLGLPAWLLPGGLGSPAGRAVPLSFPVVHPGASKAAGQAAGRPAPPAVSSLWLVFAIGVACLVGVAGGLGRLESRRSSRRTRRGQAAKGSGTLVPGR